MRKFFVLFLTCAAVGACGDSSGPSAPAAIVLVGSSSQWGIVGQPVADSVRIQIRDSHGSVLKDVPFTVTIAGGGRLVGTPSATTSGTTTVGAWTLGPTIGTQSLTIQAGALSLTINVSALQAAPASATANGVPQFVMGVVGSASTIVPAIKVADEFGNAEVGLEISVSVFGGGSIQLTHATTDAGGVATFGTWTYGTIAGTQTVALIAPHLSPVVFTATVNPGAAVGMSASSAITGDGGIGTAAPFQPSVKVVDAFGNGVSNVALTVSPSAGSSVQFANPVTNSLGVATTGAWTLSTIPGVNTLTMTAPGFAPVTFTAPGARVPSSIVTAAGKFQTIALGTPLAVNPVFKVLDFVGNPLAGTTVQFAVTYGGGSLGVASAVTDSLGQASPGNWTLGSIAGSQTVQASVQTSAGLAVQNLFATALASGNSAFNLQVRFPERLPSAAVQSAFDAGSARIAREITGHLTSRTFSNFPANVTCSIFGGTLPAVLPTLNETISDLLLFVLIAPIDGPGGTVASTRVCTTRDRNTEGSSLPLISVTVLDEADVDALVAAGTLNSVVLREMHHALGIGTLWDIGIPTFFAVKLVPEYGTTNPLYLGAAANKAYVAAGGNSVDGIPVENTGAVGTRDVQWREATFRTELMTSVPDTSAPLSVMTIMALADLGYAVSTASADPYTLPAGAAPGPARLRFQQFPKPR